MNRLLPMALILILLVAFRIIGSAFPETLPNFQPLAALFFCGALMAKGWRAWVIQPVAPLSWHRPCWMTSIALAMAPILSMTLR